MAKRKDAPSSVLTRSGRETSTAIQASTNPLNTRKSPRFDKQMGPSLSTVKKKPEIREKQMGSSPLRRSERGKNPMGSSPLRRSERGKNPVDDPASNVKSREKSAKISEESAEDGSQGLDGGSKKRKRYNAVRFKARYKPQRVRVETVDSEDLPHTESSSSSGDQFWSAAVGNGTPVANETVDDNADSLYQHLKPTVSELCNILRFSEGAKIVVERFLKFVIGNFNVSKEHTNILQALMISVCWICASLSKRMIDRKESFDLAKKHLNFSCEEEEADQVYEKLEKPKEMFLEIPKNINMLNAFKDRASQPEEPRKLPAVSLNPQEQKGENHGSSNEEALHSSRQSLEEDIARKERNEIDKFHRKWDEKKMDIVKDFELEQTFIRYLHRSNSSVRSEKLNMVEKEFADQLNEHERLRQVSFNVLKAAAGQVVVNDEIFLYGPAHETQTLDLVESEKEDQESREVGTALSRNPSEAQIHDKHLHETSPVVAPAEVIIIGDDSSDSEPIGSHSSEEQTADAMVKSEPIRDYPAKEHVDMENDVMVDNATLLSEPIGAGDISAIVEIVSSISHDKPVHDMCHVVVPDGIVNLNDSSNDMVSGSHTAEKHVANATILSKPIGDAPAKQNADMVNDVAGADTTVLSEPVGDIPAKQDADMGNNLSGADVTAPSEPIGNVPATEEIASGQEDEIENAVSEDDATVSSEPIGDILANQDADIENDVSGADATVLSEPIGDIPAIEEMASEQQDEDENVVSGDGAMVLTEPIRDISAKQNADMENDVSGVDATVSSKQNGDIPDIIEIASEQHDEVENVVSGDGAVVLSEPIGDIPAKQDADMENGVAGPDVRVSSETIKDIPGIEESTSEQDDEVENVVSGDGAIVLTEPIGDIPAEQHADMEIDVAGQDESLELEVPEVDCNKENDLGEGTSSPDGSHAVEARSETGQNDLVPHSDLVEMEISAINNLRSHVDSADGSQAVEDVIGTGSIDVASHAKSPELGMPVANDMASNVDSMDESRPSVHPNATGPDDIASHVDSSEMEILADNDTAPHVDSAADGSNAVGDGNETTPSDMIHIDDPCEMNMAAVDDVVPTMDSADGSHAIQDPTNQTSLHGMSQHVDSDETGMPADIDMAPNDYAADISHAVEDPNKNGSNDLSLHADSDQMEIPAANDLTPHIEYAGGSLAVEDPNGTGSNHVVPSVESAEMEIQAANCNQENAQDTTPSFLEVASPVSDHAVPSIPEIHNDSHLLQQPTENGIQDQEGQSDPTPMVETEDDNMQPVEAIQVDEIISEDSALNPHDEPSLVMSANPTITENQAAMPSTTEVLVQTVAPPITAQTQAQNASLLEQYMLNLQRNANSNQVGSRPTRRFDPLRIELEQLSSVKEKMVKSYHVNIQKMNIDCEKEIAEAIAEIRLKYCNKRLEADATFRSQKNEVENSMCTVIRNKVLAATFRRKCQDVSRGCAAVLQAHQAESMQQLHRPRGPSTCLPGQSSGTQQIPPPISATETPPQQTQPNLQIVHQPSDLFLTPLTRHPHTTNPRPANTTPIRPPITTNRPPPMINPRLNPFGTSAATSGVNTETCAQSPQIRPLVSRVTRSTAPHMRPLVNRDMQPLASSDIRSSTSHMRPSNPTSSSVQPLPPLPRERFPVPPPSQPRSESPKPPPPSQLPYASPATSAHSSLPSGPSVPQSGGLQDKLNDNINALTDNAARGLNILKTPDFPGGGNSAQPPFPSAHEVVCLSDDD